MNSKNTRRRSSKRPRPQRKKQYRIRNWSQYNAALVGRGSLTLWLDQQALQGWENQHKSGRRGASYTYSASAILCALSLQSVYHLPLRATQGLLLSLFQLLQVKLPVPDYTTLCRRRQTLPVSLPRYTRSRHLHLVVDSTGFKVYGEGEWKVRSHGWSKRRTWRKLHLGIDQASGEIVAALASSPQVHDKEALPRLLDQIDEPVAQVSADGNYDYVSCYELLAPTGARATIAPRRNARIWNNGQVDERDKNLHRIRELQGRRRKDKEWGRRQWKQESGYHRRSLVETGMFRLKTIFGERLGARSATAQDRELLLRCALLNQMTKLGMPDSYAL